jgi:hypothetical protein
VKLSASKMGLARLCLYWTRDDVPWPEETTSPAAEIGTWYHAVCAWTIGTALGLLPEGTPIPEPPKCLSDASELTPRDDANALLAELDEPAGEIGRAEIRTEVAYVYSPHGTRFVGFDIGRDYGALEPGEIPGTADVVVLWPGESLAIVVDWKSGQRVDSARENAQLALLALCVHEHHGVDTVEVQLRYADGYVDRHTYDAFGLVDVKDEIDALIFNASGASTNGLPEPRPGLHCAARYCPICATCPRTVEALQETDAVGETPALALVEVASNGSGAITGPAHAASLWHRAEAAQALLDSVVAAVKGYVDTNGPLPLGDGKELACVDETRESIEASTIQAVYEPVAQWVPAERFAECINVSVPKGALEKAIKEGAERGKKTDVWDAALEALRVAGRIKSRTITKHRVRKSKEKAA